MKNSINFKSILHNNIIIYFAFIISLILISSSIEAQPWIKLYSEETQDVLTKHKTADSYLNELNLQTIPDIWQKCPEELPALTVDSEKPKTYKEVRDQSRQLAAFLYTSQPDIKVVGIVMRPSPEAVITSLGVMLSGKQLIMLPPTGTDEKAISVLKGQIEIANPDYLIGMKEDIGTILKLRLFMGFKEVK